MPWRQDPLLVSPCDGICLSRWRSSAGYDETVWFGNTLRPRRRSPQRALRLPSRSHQALRGRQQQNRTTLATQWLDGLPLRPDNSIAPPQRTHDAKITALLRQNDVAASFWRNNDVIIASCVHWDLIPVACFITEVNPSLAKPPLNLNGCELNPHWLPL